MIGRFKGLFANSHMPYDKDRDVGTTGHPSLSEMVSKAIDVLSRDKEGFLLIVSEFIPLNNGTCSSIF